jgi:hypothetical protein
MWQLNKCKIFNYYGLWRKFSGHGRQNFLLPAGIAEIMEERKGLGGLGTLDFSLLEIFLDGWF